MTTAVDGPSSDPDAVPDAAGPATSTATTPLARGRRLRAAGVVAAGAVLAVGAWSLLAAHPDGPLFGGEPRGWGSCSVRPDRPEVDYYASVPAAPVGDVTITNVRAVGATNVEVAEGLLVPWSDDGVDPEMFVGHGWSWPPAPEPDVDYDLASGRGLVGGRVGDGERTAIVLRVHILDPGATATYDGIVIDYRSGPLRYSARVNHHLELPAHGDVCS